MKKTGDYTLQLAPKAGQKEGDSYRIKSIVWEKSTGALPCFNIKTVSAHGEYYDLDIGMVFRFTLRNNKTGKSKTYVANES